VHVRYRQKKTGSGVRIGEWRRQAFGGRSREDAPDVRHLGRLYLIDMATREYISSNMPASAHAVLRDHYAFWNFWLTLGALVPTAALLCLVLVTDDFAQRAFHVSPDALKLINASVALFAFVCVLVQLVWKPDSREAAHAHAVGYFAKTRLEAGSFLDERDALNVRGLPPIRHATFVRLKQLHLQATYLSRRLEIDPWLSLPKHGRPPRGYEVPEPFAPDILNLPRIGRRPTLGLATPARRVPRIRRRISRARDAPRARAIFYTALELVVIQLFWVRPFGERSSELSHFAR